VHYLENKVLYIVDTRCNHEVYMKNISYITENTLDSHDEDYSFNNLYLLPETNDTHAQNTV